MFKFNNKETRMTSMASLLLTLLLKGYLYYKTIFRSKVALDV